MGVSWYYGLIAHENSIVVWLENSLAMAQLVAFMAPFKDIGVTWSETLFLCIFKDGTRELTSFIEGTYWIENKGQERKS